MRQTPVAVPSLGSSSSGPVRVSHLCEEERLAAVAARDEALAEKLATLALLKGTLDPKRVRTGDTRTSWEQLRDAWVELVQEHMGTGPVCFFTGTYTDPYGYAHGCMLPRNVAADWRRFLEACGSEQADWTLAIEAHKTGRPVLHLHALVGGCGMRDMHKLEALWTASRGWAKAVPCIDGGVRYVCKYALKGATPDTFAWSWSR